MNWDLMQTKIADRYCGTVVVLDDEIYQAVGSARKKKVTYQIDERFQRAKRAFEAKGTLCDLLSIESQFDDSHQFRSIKRVIERSDAVVVDWYLGLGKDSSKDPVNALKVLRILQKCPGIRFAVIHSKESPDAILKTLRSEFGKAFKELRHEPPSKTDAEGDGVVVESAVAHSAVPRSAPSTYQISESTYICVLQKDKGYESAQELPDLFHAQLRSVFSDHLHWVGLEFAGRVKDILPGFVRNLPSGMDVGLVFQMLFQGENELADDLAECFCLELRELFRLEPIQSATDQVLHQRLKNGLQALEGTPRAVGLRAAWMQEMKKRKTPAELKQWVESQKVLADKGKRQDASTIIERSIPTDKPEAGNSHLRYAALREHQHCARSKDLTLYPGVVMMKTATRKGKQTRSWMLCVTPSCDCARGIQRHHLFVTGEAQNTPGKAEGRGVSTSLCLSNQEFEIRWLVKKFQTVECGPKGPKGWRLVTRLREPFVQQVVQLLWGQQARVGVNTSEFMRETRGDKE